MTLDEYLIETGTTESAFALRIKRSQAAVNRYRRGKRRPPPETAYRIEDETGGRVPFGLWYGRGAQEAA